jgi:dipeptidyl-peptidase-4
MFQRKFILGAIALSFLGGCGLGKSIQWTENSQLLEFTSKIKSPAFSGKKDSYMKTRLSFGQRPSRRFVIVLCFALLLQPIFATTLYAQENKLQPDNRVQRANYELASRWTSQKVGKLIFDTAVIPHWLENEDRFWYSFETNQGKKFYLVDPLRKTKTPLFDNAKLAAMLTNATRIPYDAQHIPIKSLKFIRKDTAVRFEVEVPKDAEITDLKKDEKSAEKEKTDKDADKDAAAAKVRTIYFEYELATSKLTLLNGFEPPKKPRWASVSPDEKTIVFARANNLYMMDAENYAKAQKKEDDESVVETQITTDGIENYSYARRLTDEDKREIKKSDKDKREPRTPVNVSWSKDSRKFSIVRADQRKVADLWVINSLSNPRPTLETYRYAMPGEANVNQYEMYIFDRESKARVMIKSERFKDQSLSIPTAKTTARARESEKVTPQWVSDTSDKLYFTRLSRDMHKMDVCVANTETGEVKTLIEERLNTYIESKPLRLVNNGQEIIFWSERDGWGHYYLYDGNGVLKNQITSGEYVCDDIEGVDEKTRTLYFNAYGREANEDPYYSHFYKVSLDGANLKLLDAGDASHNVFAADSNKYFVDNASKVNAAPKAALYDSLCNLLLELETTDLSAAMEAGFKFPEAFKVKADDGITDLYGVMYKPFDFDANKKYPIIAYVYPGPQTESVTKTFSPRNPNVALAQFGFIVIEVGNRGGNPQRSKWYHNYGYGNLRDYGLADKKAAIEQLSRKYSYIDIDRVGIYGHSGGGFMSTAAMLIYPDFFKVAVSSSGNHENNVYNKEWSEKHHGVKEVTDKEGNTKFEYSIDKNSEIAKNLKGHLMLATGDIDDNVHMAGTLRLADALIKANKRFDMLVIPGKRHGYADATDYFFWVRADYFCRYLLNDSASNVDIVELNREKEQSGTRRGSR